MKIAIISDIHDRDENVKKVIEKIKELKITEVIALGDYCYPGIPRYFAKTGLKFRCIFGNNDGDRAGMMEDTMDSNGLVTFSRGEFDEYEIDGKKVFVTHYPQIAEAVVLSGKYNAVFYGHDHVSKVEKLKNNCLLLNPGEIAGTKTGKITFGIWDTSTNDGKVLNP